MGYSHTIEKRTPTLARATIQFLPIPGWQPVATADSVEWKPVYQNIDAEKQQSFADEFGRRITVYLGVYKIQSGEKDLIKYGNGAFHFSEDGSSWSWTANTSAPPLLESPQPWSYTMYKSQVVRDGWQWFLVGGKIYTSPTRAKIASALSRLEGGRTEAATLILSSERFDSQQSRDQDLLKFSKSIGPVLPRMNQWLELSTQMGDY